MDRCEVSENCHHLSPGAQGSQRRLVSGLLLWVGLLTVSHVVSITLLVITRPHALVRLLTCIDTHLHTLWCVNYAMLLLVFY